MYERLEILFGKENLLKLHSKNILLVGVGGVGSFCYETLIRSGIKNITIIDFDTYEISNLNRQLHANLSNIGHFKVDVIKEYTKNINKDINVDIINEYLDSASTIDFSKFDYIIDACDSMDAKVFLIKKALEYNKKIICSMGIGNRVDPNKIMVSKLSKTYNDPLSKKLRNTLKKENISLNIPVVFSSELPIKSDKISSYMTVTGYAGMLLADYVIKDIIND